MQVERFKSITLAAIALAHGGRFLRPVIEGQVLKFEIEHADTLDFTDPHFMVPVPALIAWSESLTTKLREHNRAMAANNQRGAAR